MLTGIAIFYTIFPEYSTNQAFTLPGPFTPMQPANLLSSDSSGPAMLKQ